MRTRNAPGPPSRQTSRPRESSGLRESTTAAAKEWLGAVSLSFRVAVRVGVMLGGLFRMMLGMKRMTVGDVAVVTGLLMISGFVMFRRGAMMARGMLMVFCCLTMMFSCLFRHRILSLEVQNEIWTMDLGSE